MRDRRSNQRHLIERLFERTDVAIDGDRPWDLRIHDPGFHACVVAEGTLGLGEAYMDGWWDCDALDEFFHRVIRHGLQNRPSRTPRNVAYYLRALLSNRQNKQRAFVPAEVHYDLGHDLFEGTFDTRLTGSCGYWKDVDDLDAAQEAKHDLICRKLGLKPGERVLGIGCGWVAFMKFAAERYGVECSGVTVSREQVAWGQDHCKGLPVTFRLMDYRNLEGEFDHVVSMGMFEHVGYRNDRVYFETAHRCLRDGGLFLLHTIGSSYDTRNIEPWLDRYIFPGGVLPSISQIGKALEHLFVVEDWHNFGADYDKTLMAWNEKFERSWPSLSSRYDERFYRMWRYYLLSGAGGFRARQIQLWQLVLSKDGVPGGHLSVR